MVPHRFYAAESWKSLLGKKMEFSSVITNFKGKCLSTHAEVHDLCTCTY